MFYNTISGLLEGLNTILETTAQPHFVEKHEKIGKVIGSYINTVSLGIFGNPNYYAFIITPGETIAELFTRIGIPLDLGINITIGGHTAQYESIPISGDWIFIKPKVKTI